MINLSYNVRISRREGYIPPPRLFDFQALPTGPKDYLSPLSGVGPSSAPWEAILFSKEDNLASPVVEYGLSLEALNEHVVTPFTEQGNIRLAGCIISFGAMERIEIRAKGANSVLPSYLNHFFDRISEFEWNGTDVTKEFIKDPPPWGPSIGAPERPESIPVDQLFDRLVTNELLRDATRDRFRSRNFTDAVEAAFKCLANAVKERSGHHERDGADLMRHVFGARSPLLKLSALRSQSEKDEHDGYRDIFAGVMIGIRNPRAHEHAIKDDPTVALELLTIANHLMRKLDHAARDDAQPEEAIP